ncbi:MAG: hypothetical protein U5S82_05570 [Gammaproteobacteria bacterium]|nr:hypothetical protein [Gammaproteobacteria bacterium]
MNAPEHFPASSRPGAARWWPAAALLVLAAPAPAVERLTITVGAVEGADGSGGAAAITLDLGESDAGLALTAEIEELRLAAVPGLSRIAVDCPALAITGDAIACDGGSARLGLPQLDDPAFDFSIRHVPGEGHFEATLSGLRAAGGRLAATASGTPRKWRLELEAAGLGLSALGTTLAPWLPPLPEGFEYSGDGRIHGILEGGETLRHFTIDAALEALAFSDASGLRAGEGMAATLEATGSHDGGGWKVDAGMRLTGGAFYVDPWYVAVAGEPLSAHCAAGIGDGGGIHHARCRFHHPGVLEAATDLHGTPQAGGLPADGRLTFSTPALGEAYKVYLQPLLAGTPGDRLAISGTADGRVTLEAGIAAAAELHLGDIALEDEAGRFGIHGLGGDLHWRREGKVSLSELLWQGGYLWRLDFGASRLALRAAARGLELEEALSLPLLDGALVMESFAVDSAGDGVEGVLEGYLTPISMERLSAAFGWPPFRGRLSGVLPRVAFSHQRVTIDGALLMNIFDGRVVLRNLLLERPLGPVPELRANLDINRLDLDLLTSALSFGRIQGRLDGSIHNLILQDWQPVAFDARFDTPDDGDFRKRISQEAVNDLTQVGGGAGIGGALFMGLFKEFRYDAIGLGCELADGVCVMSGVAPADQGYYLVRGSGLPRIDIIGYNRLVDWDTLLTRLRRVTTSGPARVE